MTCVVVLRHILQLLGLLAVAPLVSIPLEVRAETLQKSTVETRLLAFVQAPEAAVRKRLPPGFELNTYSAGPFQGANLVLIFAEQHYGSDPAGKPLPASMDRKFVACVPVKNAKTSQAAIMVIGGWSIDPTDVPGPYKNFTRPTEFRHETTASGAGTDFGVVDDRWFVSAGDGGKVDLRVRYQRSMASRAKLDLTVYSSVEPSFYRIYRVDQGAEVIRSIPAKVDRAADLQFVVKAPWLADLFDGTEHLVAVASLPWYVRQVFLPDPPKPVTSG